MFVAKHNRRVTCIQLRVPCTQFYLHSRRVAVLGHVENMQMESYLVWRSAPLSSFVAQLQTRTGVDCPTHNHYNSPAMANKPTSLDRLRHFRGLMGDPKEHLTEDEYEEYLVQSESLCGRLWANLNAEDQESAGSIFSVSEMFESLAEEEEQIQTWHRDTSSSNSSLSTFTTVVGATAPSLEDHSFADFADEILSSTFIIEEDPDFSVGLSREEFFDLFDENEGGRRLRVIMEDRKRMAFEKPMTSPCA